MEHRRWLTFILLSYVVIMFFTMLMEKNAPKKPAGAASDGTTTSTLALDRQPGGPADTGQAISEIEGARTAPVPAEAPRVIENTSVTIAAHPGEVIPIKTKKYNIAIDKVGAVFNSMRLLDPGSQSYVKSDETSLGIELVRRIPAQTDPAGAPQASVLQTWPLEVTFKEANARSYEDFNNVPWEVRATRGESGDNQIVQLGSPAIRGIRVQKTFSVPENSYYSNVKVTVFNDNETTIAFYDDINRGLTVRWGPGLVERDYMDSNASGDAAYDNAFVRMNDEIRSFHPEADEAALETDGLVQWAGVESKFFAAIMVPFQPKDSSRLRHYYFRTLVPAAHKFPRKEFIPPLTMELSTDRFDLAPQQSYTFEFNLYMGPKKHSILKQYDAGLQTLMFHNSWSFMRAIYRFMTDLLNWIHKYVGNYGIAIMLLTIIVRLAMFPLTHKQIKIQAKTMHEMQKIKPYLDQINEKYKNDPQEKQKQTMRVYREHNVNPFATLRGCVPIFFQMPIFIGLYRVCSDTIDLQGAQFLWVKDLSIADHLFPFGVSLPLLGPYFNLLPILMGATQMISTWISMARVTSMDPTQKQMMYFMPIMMIFFLYHLPAGLMVYWIASNTWQIFQTMITNKIMAIEEEKHKMNSIGGGGSGIAAAQVKKPIVTVKPSKKK